MIDTSFTAFRPVSTTNVSGTITSARVEIAQPADAQAAVRYQARIVNGGSTLAFVAFGDSTVTATVNDIPIVANWPSIFTIPPGATHMAVIYGVGSGSVYCSLGFGR